MTFTSSQTCYISGCSPKHANDIDKVLKLSTKPEPFCPFFLTVKKLLNNFENALNKIPFRLNFLHKNVYKSKILEHFYWLSDFV